MSAHLPRIGLLVAGNDASQMCGQVVEGGLERGHAVHLLSPTPVFKGATTHTKGSPLSHRVVERFLYATANNNDASLNVDVVIGLNVPGRMEGVATALAKALQNKTHVPRVVWMTGVLHSSDDGDDNFDIRSLAETDDDSEESDENSADNLVVLPPPPQQPLAEPCFELVSRPMPFFGLQLDCLFPFFASKNPMDDMAESEQLLREAAAVSNTPLVIVRPTRMVQSLDDDTVTTKDRNEQRYYQFVGLDEAVPSHFAMVPIPPRAVATALLDLAFDTNRDGTVVEVYKRDKKMAPIVSEQVDL